MRAIARAFGAAPPAAVRPRVKKAIVAAAICAVLCWQDIEFAFDIGALTLAVLMITARGVIYSAPGALLRVVNEMIEGIMVLANFLTQHLLAPLKERQREQWRDRDELLLPETDDGRND